MSRNQLIQTIGIAKGDVLWGWSFFTPRLILHHIATGLQIKQFGDIFRVSGKKAKINDCFFQYTSKRKKTYFSFNFRKRKYFCSKILFFKACKSCAVFDVAVAVVFANGFVAAAAAVNGDC